MQFFRRGKSSAWFVPTISSTSAPTATEINAGTDLSKAVTAIENFDTSTARISQAVLAYVQNLQIDGEQTFGDASMTILEDDGTAGGDSVAFAAADTALAELATGYVVLASNGVVATKKVEVWPIKVLTKNRQWTTDNEMAKKVVQFAVTGIPVKDATVAS